MAIFEWRKFNFCDLRKDVDSGQLATSLKDAEITSVTNGNNQIVICDSFGFIHLINRKWETITIKGHDSPIILCALVRQHNILVTIGNEENGLLPSFKVWNLSKVTKSGIMPCLRTVKTSLQKPTALAVAESGQFMAIGFDRGGISLYRGDISRDRVKNVQSLSCGSTLITGIAFKLCNKLTQMFVCTDSSVLVYSLSGKDKETKIVLDSDKKKPIRCFDIQATIQSTGGGDTQFMVGKDDGIYCYTIDGRGPCYALDGEKSIIRWFRSYLLTISKPTINTISSQKSSILTVIDIANKFIVFSSPMDNVAGILIEFGTCFLITQQKEVYQLDEKDLQSKLNLLFKKNLYDIAVRIAKNNEYDAESLADIFKQYGDHLYSKCKFASAVEQYTKTIGYLEPSYIIRRFLDSRHIHFLTDYLQVLHRRGYATADHTTLLLNCFTRLDRPEELKEFLRNDENPDIMFDLDVAIKVCRTASIEHALSLAKRNKKHDSYLSILIDDLHAYQDAIQYIGELNGFIDAKENLRKYGIILMKHCPMETTQVLKRLCTNFVPLTTTNGTTTTATSNEMTITNTMLIDMDIAAGGHNHHDDLQRANAEDFFQLFDDAPYRLIDFLEHLLNNLSTISCRIVNTLIELYLNQWKTDLVAENRLMEILQNDTLPYDRNHALILCRMVDFWPGILLIYEEQKLYHLIVHHYLKQKDYNNLLIICKRLGTSQPSLWLQALTGLRADKDAPSNLLSQILQVIAQEKLQSPLQVLNCLAVEDGPNLQSVRDYFLQIFQKETDSLKFEEELVAKYRKDSIGLKNHVRHLVEGPIEFRGTLCDTCHQALNMPAIYFQCQHCYHQDCVRRYSDNDKECPVCHTKIMQLKDALNAQNESRDQHELFHDLLDRSTDPFSVVAEYFGRGLFNKIVIIDEDDEQNDLNKNIPASDSTNLSNPNNNNNNKNTIPTTKATISSAGGFGAGAEAKLRIDERQTNKELAIKAIPVPEGRMRMQEANNYSSSLEANISRNDQRGRIGAGGGGANILGSSSKSQQQSSTRKIQTGATSMAGTIAGGGGGAIGSNPFEKKYDSKKNPFGEDDDDDDDDNVDNVDGGIKKITAVAADVAGSSGSDAIDIGREYDDNLNPFA